MVELYDILTSIDKLSLSEYDRLISVYGKQLVNHVIDVLVMEDEENLYKFNVCYAKEDNSFEDIKDLSIYDIYVSDVSSIPCFDSEMNMKYMTEAYGLIQEMEDIFKKIGCDDTILKGKRVPWLADKVDYCLKTSKDINLLNKLNDLYKRYCYVRDGIVNGNLRLVIKIASEYRDEVVSFEDIIQDGNTGLIRAVEKFDINKDVTFNTYAVYWIRQRIMRGIKSLKYPVRLPVNIIFDSFAMMTARNQLSLQLGRNVTIDELAQYMNVSVKKLERLVSYFIEPMYLDEILESKYDDVEYLHVDFVEDSNVDAFSEVVDSEYRDYLMKYLSDVLKEKEYLLLKYYSGLGEERLNLFEIARMWGVTEQRVSQIKQSATRKLRKMSNIRDIVIV